MQTPKMEKFLFHVYRLIIIINFLLLLHPPFTSAEDKNWALENKNNPGTPAGPCVPSEYIQRGHCQKYFTCNQKSKHEIKRSCGEGLYWNPNINAIHGGVCDYLRNLKPETLELYKKDATCILDVSYFRSGGECSAKYFYLHPTKTEGKEVEETCSDGLVWSKLKEACDVCNLVMKKDGKTPCCDKPSDADYDYVSS